MEYYREGRTAQEYSVKVNLKNTYAEFYLTQVITRHGAIPHFQSKMFNKSNIYLCRLNMGNIEHIIKSCILTKEVRDKSQLTN